MLSLIHAPTGALIATSLPPIVSIPLILASHYIEDYIPHWDVGQGLTKKLKSKRSAFLQELFIDFPGSIALTYYLFQNGKPFNPYIWLGWFVALLPDFLEFPYTFFNWRFWPLKHLADFHSSVHHSTHKKIKGLLPQAIIILIIYLITR